MSVSRGRAGMHRTPTLFFLALASLASLAARADQGSVTYAFTGTVYGRFTGGTLQPPIGSLVTGTYTFDLAAGVATQSQLPISGTSEWFVLEGSGPDLGISTLNPDYVFSDTVHIGRNSYRTNPVPGPYQSDSYVEGIPGAIGVWIVGGPSGGNVYLAGEYQISSANGQNLTDSSITLDNPNHDPWSGVGLPFFADGTLGQGLFLTEVNGVESGVIYDIDSLRRVHGVAEPTTLSLFALGLAGVGLVRRRKASWRSCPS